MINLRLRRGGSAYSGDISVFCFFFFCVCVCFFFLFDQHMEGLSKMLLDADEGRQEPDVTACDRQGDDKRQQLRERITSRKMCVGG